ncbi:MAG: TRAP transporter small permease [Betaproteobacteria bacterium]|nr:MAG: TRAP transporter small permease [Betaproteobacteria bacterium]
MTVVICADVLLRNVALIPGVEGLPWSNELSETTLYLVTMLAAPWLLREGRHIRVDIVLRALPARAAWFCEWLCDVIALACCVCVAIYATRATWESFSQGSITIKTLVLPEWWTLAPLPVAFLLLSVELLFRMRRLWLGPRAPREDAVTSA